MFPVTKEYYPESIDLLHSATSSDPIAVHAFASE
jgi:hypothetical protein